MPTDERRRDLRVVLFGLGVLAVLSAYLGSVEVSAAFLLILAVIVGVLMPRWEDPPKYHGYHCSAQELGI